MSEVDRVFRQYFGTSKQADESRSEPRVKTFTPELRGIDEAKRQITFVASTETPDRYGDVIRVAGWNVEQYKKNPVFLWSHRSSDPPVGKTVSIVKETSPSPALVHVVQFADAQTYPFASQIFNLYKGGFLSAVSVGFRPTARPKAIIDEATGESTGGYEFTSQELLELSAVPIPANPEAVARAIDSGIVREAEVAKFFSLDKEVPNDLATRADLLKLQESASRFFSSAQRAIAALRESGEQFGSQGHTISTVQDLEKLWRLS